jgi:hypothetical protein
MAFFGLTKLGYQDTIREHVRDPSTTPISAFRSGQYRDPNFSISKAEKCGTPPDVAKKYDTPDDASSFAAQTVAYGQGPCSSNEELHRMRQKHIRNPAGLCFAVAACNAHLEVNGINFC